MTKQEQIDEIAVLGCVRNPKAYTAEECGKCGFKQGMCNAYRHAEALYNVGYRKAEEVRKETAEEILQYLYDKCFELGEDGKCSLLCDVIHILHLAKQYGVEIKA